MKKILTLFLSVLLLSGLLACAAAATETSTAADNHTAAHGLSDSFEDYTSDEKIAVHALADYDEIHTLDECHEMLQAMMANDDLQDGDGTAAPYAVVHCQSSAGIGRYVEQLVSTTTTRETQNCVHGAVGVIDARTVTTKVYRQYCTLCAYESSYSVENKGLWVCQG